MKRRIKRCKIYFPFIGAGMQEVASYRVNWIFYMLGNVMACAVSYFIWKAVYASGSSESMNGFTMPQMIVYIVMMFLTNTMIASDASYVIGEEVRDGAIIMRMLKPISYNATFLFQEIGNKLFTEFIIALPLVFAVEAIRAAFAGSVQFNVLRFLLFLFSAATAYLLNFFFNICFGFAAFITKNLWGVNTVKNCVVGFLSGSIIPLSFLPGALESVFLFLPFASLNYTPVMIYMGKYSGGTLWYYLGLQIFWAAAFWGLSKLLWKVVSRRLTAQGG